MEKITPNELRMGNWITHPNGEIFQSTEYTQLIIMRDGKDFKPVPLTEQWLLKFGYTYSSDLGLYYDKNSFALEKVIHGERWDFYHGNRELTCIDYVHQLQNLFFALTGSELEIQSAVGKV